MSSEALPGFPFPACPGARPPARYAQLVAEPGLPRVLLPSGVEALLVTRYEEVRTVLSDDRFSREAFPGRPMFARSPESISLAVSDPPVHTRRRRAVLPDFTARQARRLAPRVRELAERASDGLAALPQPADLVEGFTAPFALSVVTELLGMPAADGQRLRPLMAAMTSVGGRTPEEVAEAHRQVQEYFADLVDQHVARIAAGRPGADVLSRLLTAPQDGRLSRREVVVFGAGTLMAGFETTANQLAMTVLTVLRRPGLAGRLRSDPAALERAVEETLRWSALIGTGGAAHVALADVRVGEVLVRAGEVVVPLHDAANQDAAVFERPEVFDPGRTDNPHLAFGHGRHLCLGAPLARTELRTGLAVLLDRFPDLRPAGPEESLRWREDAFIRGPLALPVRWDAPSRPAAGGGAG
ncbi:cytochrome P450 [Kitasatospora phosalacinea]|uniref:Cytochrome P450 n=1 Tax=Kitasatospora phosalacinea TaxID=2065 RepID=A0A9W6Q1T4_9ACTN|nr:cytochrome P450 [Kitasatospora phosalacinea]GLW68384.1 cytochrome P450 [Kitasatospora phosalacinea]